MPNENLDGLEQPSPGEIGRMESDWKAELYEAERAEKEARTRELLKSTDRMLEMLKKPEAGPDAAEPAAESVFEVPSTAQAQLDAARADFERAWESKDSSSTPQTSEQIREELAKEGLRPEPPTAEEIEAAGLQEATDKRAEAAAARNQDKKHARNLHRKSPTRYVSPRDKGAPEHVEREIRGDSL